MNRTIFCGYMNIITEQAKSTMFLMSVSTFVSIIASPKHPQSDTGFAIAIQTVMAVIIAMKANISFDVACRRIAKRVKIPNENSTAASPIAMMSVSQSGMKLANPKASR